jgi:hypothetical protein
MLYGTGGGANGATPGGGGSGAARPINNASGAAGGNGAAGVIIVTEYYGQPDSPPTNVQITAPAFVASGLTGATAASRYAGATTSGAPTSGSFGVGDFVIDETGQLWVCTAAGSPGTWIGVGSNLIWDSTVAGVTLPAASVSTPTLPTNYKHLLIVWTCKTASASTDTLMCQFNGSASGYDYQTLKAGNTTVTAAQAITQTAFAMGDVSSSATSGFGHGLSFIADYNGVTSMISVSGAVTSAPQIELAGGSQFGSVQSMKFLLNSGSNIAATSSRFSIYGLN